MRPVAETAASLYISIITSPCSISVFPGYEELLKHAANNGADENGTFDRRFLLQILSMGHSQFAQWIGAKGPNTAINNACASTPAAFSIAEDWITTGRASRVIIVSADNTTSDVLLEWIGAGFAGAGVIGFLFFFPLFSFPPFPFLSFL